MVKIIATILTLSDTGWGGGGRAFWTPYQLYRNKFYF